MRYLLDLSESLRKHSKICSMVTVTQLMYLYTYETIYETRSLTGIVLPRNVLRTVLNKYYGGSIINTPNRVPNNP